MLKEGENHYSRLQLSCNSRFSYWAVQDDLQCAKNGISGIDQLEVMAGDVVNLINMCSCECPQLCLIPGPAMRIVPIQEDLQHAKMALGRYTQRIYMAIILYGQVL